MNNQIDLLIESLVHLVEQFPSLTSEEREILLLKARARALEEGWEKSPFLEALERFKKLG